MALDEFKPYTSPNGCVMPLKCLYARMINGFYVPCGKCEFCRKSRAREWAFRLNEEAYDKYVYNCMLTYSDEHLPYYKGKPSLNKVDVQLFLKRFRESVRKEFGTTLKYFLCGEYGGNYHRPHYHMILFSEKPLTKRSSNPYWLINKIIEDAWRHGIADIEPMNNIGGNVHYLTSYMTTYSDGVEYDSHNKPFLLMSRCGLGKKWISRHPQQVAKMIADQDYSSINDGYKLPLPRYLRRKIMPEEQQIARADSYYQYCNEFENNFNKQSHEQRNNYFKRLKQDRESQKQREYDDYRKGKIHSNNTNTSQLSHRTTTAEEF